MKQSWKQTRQEDPWRRKARRSDIRMNGWLSRQTSIKDFLSLRLKCRSKNIMFLYLIKSGNFLKIGITSDLSERMRDYFTHNPIAEIIGVKQFINSSYSKASAIDAETIFKRKFRHLSLERSSEWFYEDQSIIAFFNSIQDQLLTSESTESDPV